MTDHERQEPYCHECGGDDLACVMHVANGVVWQCRDCDHLFVGPSLSSDATP